MALLDSANKRIAVAATLLVIAIALFVAHNTYQPKAEYHHNNGGIFGTTYHIIYLAEQDYHEDIKQVMLEVDSSLSVFNPQSTISHINEGSSDVDKHFVTVFNKSAEIYRLSDGAFDITVSPLVEAWGFGKSDLPHANQQIVDSILLFVGFNKLHLTDGKLTKDDPRITMNASAIAKGYGCDVVAHFLESKEINNYIVEIGGEIVCRGVNEEGELWHIGITQPTDDVLGSNNKAQEIICGDIINLATSGTYRQFYYENGIRRSHTIDPRTGCPVSNNLVSATVISVDCMTADGLATACMVMGKDESLELIESLDNTECYLICEEDGQYIEAKSSGFDKYLVNE